MDIPVDIRGQPWTTVDTRGHSWTFVDNGHFRGHFRGQFRGQFCGHAKMASTTARGHPLSSSCWACIMAGTTSR
jgi:hypothetical protein